VSSSSRNQPVKRLSHPSAGLSPYPYAPSGVTGRASVACVQGETRYHYRSSTRTSSIATTKTGHGFQKISHPVRSVRGARRATSTARLVGPPSPPFSRICWRLASSIRFPLQPPPIWFLRACKCKGTPTYLTERCHSATWWHCAAARSALHARSCGIRDLDPYEHNLNALTRILELIYRQATAKDVDLLYSLRQKVP